MSCQDVSSCAKRTIHQTKKPPGSAPRAGTLCQVCVTVWAPKSCSSAEGWGNLHPRSFRGCYKALPQDRPKSLTLTPVVHATNHSRFSSVEEKELPDICSRSCGKPIILEGKLSTDNWKYRLLTDGLLTKLQLLLRWCHIESRKHLVIFSRCIILSHPER